MPLCLSCHTQVLERARAVKELKRVQREARAQEERRSLRAGRRRKWIEGGGALSDSFSEDESEQENQNGPWDWGWGEGDDMNYSTHS